jgi:hypothetical protein
VPRILVVLSVFAVLVAAALTACGSDDSGKSSTSDQAAATSGATAAAPASTAAPAPAATTAAPAATTPAPAPKLSKTQVVATCHKTFDPYIAALRKVNKAVAGDPNYKQYSARTKALGARYRTLKTAGIPSTTCQHEVNVTIATAYMQHLTAVNTWTACRKRDNCNRTMAGLKQQWRAADKATAAAAKGFRNVTPS